MPITGRVLAEAARHPDRIAVADADRSLSYAGLVADSRTLAAAIGHLHASRAAAVRPARQAAGIPITTVSLTGAFDTARIIAGLAGYRAVTATIDPRWPLSHQVGIIRAAGIGVVVADSPALAQALAGTDWGGCVVTTAELARLQREMPPAAPPAVRDGAEPFLLLFSSGTTRHPKAFIKTREQYRQNFAVSSAHLEPLPGVATLAPGPVSYSLTLYAVIESLASGGSIYLADSFDPIAAGRLVESAHVTRVVAVPAMVAALAQAARRDPQRFSSLDLIVTGGANLSAAMRAALAATLPDTRLISYYGAAEIGFIGDSRAGDGTVIDLYDGIEARLRRPDGTDIDCGDDELGELWVKAAACSDGYVTGTSDEVLRDADGWATVHDQARWAGPDDGPRPVSAAANSDGGTVAGRRRVRLVGRAGDIAVTAGHKVSLAEVDRAFDGAPGVAAACAVALPDDRRGTVVVLVVETAGGIDRAALTAWARKRLAPQFVPRRWYVADALPRTVGGKIRRDATRDMVLAGEAVRL